MAVLIKVKMPQTFMDEIMKAIDENKIQTWTYDSDNDLTHSLDQWKNKAWMRPRAIKDSEIYNFAFGFIGNKNVVTTKVLYAVYHGRLVETLLSHFDTDITEIFVTSMPDRNLDYITSNGDAL